VVYLSTVVLHGSETCVSEKGDVSVVICAGSYGEDHLAKGMPFGKVLMTTPLHGPKRWMGMDTLRWHELCLAFSMHTCTHTQSDQVPVSTLRRYVPEVLTRLKVLTGT